MVSPLNWLALVAIAVLFLAALLWIFFGSIQRVADGPGIIIRDSNFGLFEVAGQGKGTVAEVLVKEGDVVTAGQAIARMQLTELQEQIATSEKLLSKLKQADTSDANWHQQILNLELHLQQLQIKFENELLIRTAHAGRVIEVSISAGNVIPAGQTILRLESLQGEYELLAYVSAAEGKKIRVGMDARIVPSTATASIQGYLRGQVNYVSIYPVTHDYLSRELGGNTRLADVLLEGGSAIEVCISLSKNAEGQFEWSNARGKKVFIESGLLADTEIVLETIRPIELIFSASQ